MARRDHSVAELKEKLLKKSDNLELIDQVIQTLIDNRFLDDARFSALLIDVKYRQGLGPHRILRLLQSKSLCADDVHATFTEEEWGEGLARTWSKRFSEKPRDNKSYTQQVRYLQYRGFSLEQINRFLREKNEQQ
ncbi:MAG: recombination regulator RecX [Gammaproteobacteria bacterium]|nr:recombination regulator RecX [Gammaproteobacteria bacterium]